MTNLVDPNGNPITSYDLADYMKIKFPYIPSLVGNRVIIPRGFTLMGTWPKVGKSYLAMQLAINRAYAEPWIGFPTAPGRTLYVNCEIVSPMFQERFNTLLEEYGNPPKDTVFLADLRGQNAYLNTEEGRGTVEGLIQQCQPDLVILDPLSKMMHGNESNPEVMQDFLQVLAEWQAKYKVAILLIHHFRKKPRDLKNQAADASMDEFSGSSLLTRDTDSIIVLDGRPGTDKITMRFDLRHDQDPKPFLIKRGDDLWWRRVEGVAIPKLFRPALELLLEKDLTRAEWLEAIQNEEARSLKTAERRVREALERGYVTEKDGLLVLPPTSREFLG